MWKLQVDHLVAECIANSRPQLSVEEILQEDGSYMPGKTVWLPLRLSFVNDPIVWEGPKDVVISVPAFGDKWSFSDAKLGKDDEGYFLTFPRVKYEKI